MYKTLIPAMAAIGLLSACGTTSVTKPTHWWSADAPISRVTYERDNNACEQASGFSGAGEVSSNSYVDYQSCMRNAGYTLVSANNT